MRKRITLVLLLSILLILGGCITTIKDSSNSLKITKEDEKIILKYLDINTNDISSARGGIMYSAFTILGTDSDKIYIWMLKEEYLKQGSEVTMTNGVALPLVLYIKTGEATIVIKNHKYPEDGEGNGKSMMKLFPEKVRKEMGNNYNERADQLEEIIKKRVKADIKI